MTPLVVNDEVTPDLLHENSPAPPARGFLWAALAVPILALSIRFVNVWLTLDVPTARHLIGDARGYDEWSNRIAAGEWLGDRGFYQAPLYPYALAVAKCLGLESVTQIRMLQATWGAAACALICLAVGRWFGPRGGVLAGVMLALYGPAIYFDGIIQKTSLDNLLVCAMLACMAGYSICATAVRAGMLGAVVSLLCLTRENAMVWHLVLPVWILVRGNEATRQRGHKAERQQGNKATRRQGLELAAYVLGGGLALAPVAVRNWHVQGEFALTTFQAGPNFFIGNSAHADGRYQPLVRGHETPQFERADATRLAQEATGRTLTPREVSRYWMGRAWGDIIADPLRWVRLIGYKLLLTWNRYEIADGESIAVYSRHSPVLLVLSNFHFGVLWPLAALGFVTTASRWRHIGVLYALIVTITVAVAAFYVLARYRYPMVPLLIPFAAVGVMEMTRQVALLWRRQSPTGDEQRVGGALAFAMGAAVFCNWPIQDEGRLDALAEMNAGVALAAAGELPEATLYFERAVDGHPASVEANYNLAMALAIQGKYHEAISGYQRALHGDPNLPGGHFNLAVALERAGRVDEAREHYRLAIEQNPADADAKAALDRLR